MTPLQTLRYHVTGAIERGEGTAIVEQRAENNTLGLLTALVAAVRPMVAMTYAEALEKDHHEMRFMFCQCDVRNPCWDSSYSATGWGENGPGKHWGGGDACQECNLRAAIAAVGA